MIQINNMNGLDPAEIKKAEKKAAVAECFSEVGRILHLIHDKGCLPIISQVEGLKDQGFDNSEVQQMEFEVKDTWYNFYCGIQQIINQRFHCN